MKKIILITLLGFSISGHTQIGGLLNKAKDKLNKKDDDKKEEVKKEEVKEVSGSSGKTEQSKSSSKKAASVNDTPSSTYVTDGVTSPIHEKYMNKIVFASKNESLLKQKEVEADFKTEFNLGEPVYFRVYTDNSIFNYIRPLIQDDWDNSITNNSSYGFNFYIDGLLLEDLDNDILSRSEFETEGKQKWTSFKGALKSADGSLFIGMNAFNEILRKHDSKLTMGKHQVKIEVYPYFFNPGKGDNVKGTVVANGEITLNVKNNVIDPNDTKMCMPAAVMTDEQLTKSMAKAYLRDYLVNADAVRIVSSKWEIERNKYTSVIVKRTLDVSIGYKDLKTGICYKRMYMASQEHDGSKFMEDLSFFSNMQNPPREISCKCLQTPTAVKETTKEPTKTGTSANPAKKGK